MLPNVEEAELASLLAEPALNGQSRLLTVALALPHA